MSELITNNPLVKLVMLKGQDGEEKLINQADGSGVSFWIGTQAEYDAIPPEDLIENCVYYITDDTRDDYATRLNQLDTQVETNTSDIENLKPRMATAESNINILTNRTARTETELINSLSEIEADIRQYFTSISLIAKYKNGYCTIYIRFQISQDFDIADYKAQQQLGKPPMLMSNVNWAALEEFRYPSIGSDGSRMCFIINEGGAISLETWGNTLLKANEWFSGVLVYPKLEND